METNKRIKFNYFYRDAGNYKVHGNVVFDNPDNIDINILEGEIRKHLIDSEFFEPEELKIPRLKHNDFPYDPDLDHSWNEFDSIEETTEELTDKRSINEFLLSLTSSLNYL